MIYRTCLLLTCGLALLARASALHDYVARPDDHYAWQVTEQAAFDGGTRYVLKMTSQAWRSTEEVDRVLWQHGLILNVPHEVKHHTALLFITGGNNAEKSPDPQQALIDIALATESVTAELYNVPNQPLVLASDPQQRQRVEDDLLAYGWAQFYGDGDPNWLVNLPMTKSAVRAMDTLQVFAQQAERRLPVIDQFVVSGASKRGWTTWLTAAVDARVTAIVPMVIDVLNIEQSISHHFQAYGAYSKALTPYVENGITDSLGTPQSRAATAIIDPYRYHRNITIPKYILNSTGDQFFLPDSTRFYYQDLLGPKALRYLPNTDHGLDDRAVESLLGFYRAVVYGRPWPTATWTSSGQGALIVQASQRPRSVQLWQADNPQARDFQLDTLGAAWTPQTLSPSQQFATAMQYEITVDPPAKGWRAFMVELTFPDPVDSQDSITLTTEVMVIPEILPYDSPVKAESVGR